MVKRIYAFLYIWSLSLTLAIAQSSDSILARHLREDRGIEVTSGNSVAFFGTGRDKFEDLFAEIRKAKSFVHLEYFNFRNDSIAWLLFDLLIEKAKEGVEVRALYDGFGNMSNNRPIKRKMQDSINSLGVHLCQFRPIKFPWLNHVYPRDHRKIVVIDGKVAFTGGMNVADYYITGTEQVGPWHDLHMHIEGPAVNDLHYIFCKTWYRVTDEALVGKKYFPDHRPVGDTKLAIVDRQLGKSSDAMRDMYVNMLNSAKKSVKLINPYFVPTHKVRKALKDAIDRGIDVQILVSEASDEPLTPDVIQYICNNLVKRGATVYMFQGGFHHSKMMIIDDIYATVGSSNLDARSLRYDCEVNTVIFDKERTQWLTNHFEKQKESCYVFKNGDWKNRAKWKRFVGWSGNLLTFVL